MIIHAFPIGSIQHGDVTELYGEFLSVLCVGGTPTIFYTDASTVHTFSVIALCSDEWIPDDPALRSKFVGSLLVLGTPYHFFLNVDR